MSKPQHQSWQAFEPCELVREALGSDLLYSQKKFQNLRHAYLYSAYYKYLYNKQTNKAKANTFRISLELCG